VLIDVSTIAREAGFQYPVALTAAAWTEGVAVAPGVLYQDERACFGGGPLTTGHGTHPAPA
jgi:hypothetical protein